MWPFCSKHDRQAERLRRLEASFGTITRNQDKLMAKLEDIQASLVVIGTEIDKIATETQSLLTKISQLQTGDPAQQALIDAIAAQAQTVVDKVNALDALVPDADAAPTT